MSYLSLFALWRRRQEARAQWMAVIRKMAPHILEWSWKSPPSNVGEAKRLVLGAYRASPLTARRFPQGLRRDGCAAFQEKLCRMATQRLGADSQVPELIGRAFETAPYGKILDHYLHDYPLRRKQPHALLPEGHALFAKWMLKQGTRKFDWLEEDALWFLECVSADPSHAESVHHAVTPKAQQTTLPTPPLTAGVNVLGHFTFCSGLQRSAVSTVKALKMAGEQVTLRNIPILEGKRPDSRALDYLGEQRHDITLLHATPDAYYLGAFDRAGVARHPDSKLIVHYAWEMPELPKGSRPVDGARELWAYSAFVADALKPWKLPVHVIHPMVTVGNPSREAVRSAREALGIAPSTCLFLYIFDLGSSMERKNPEAAIRAFQLATRPDDDARLVLKVARTRQFPHHYARLRELGADSRIVWIDEMLDDASIDTLMASCDCYLSLHRAEGFGFTMAEAMLHGKPVIATGYSGNLEFMNPSNSYLVEWSFSTTPQGTSCYPEGLTWAEPDTRHAAAWIRLVLDDRGEAMRIGLAGQRDAHKLFTPTPIAKRIAERLAACRRIPPMTPAIALTHSSCLYPDVS